MSRTQKYISLLLERLPKYELRSYEHQTSLDRIRDRISAAPDLHAELLYLYKVNRCADFALSLMWIADKVEKDSSKEESTIAEETLVFSKFRQAIGEETPSQPESDAGNTTFNLSGSQEFGAAPAPGPEPDFNLSPFQNVESNQTPELSIDSIFGAMTQPPDMSPPSGGGTPLGSDQELKFASMLEHFLEYVQSGNDDRTKLQSDIIHECDTVLASSSASEDYHLFCKLLTEFLNYISHNQYMDDVRVMNILSNIQDPFAQWARSASDNRAGLLDQVNDILRDFKTMFE